MIGMASASLVRASSVMAAAGRSRSSYVSGQRDTAWRAAGLVCGAFQLS
jgi:hypothetical protein